MAPRHLNATLGLIAAAVAIGFIVKALLTAASPAPTPVALANTGPSAVTVGEVTVVGTQPPLTLQGPWVLKAMSSPLAVAVAASAAAASIQAGSLALEPGRPVELAVVLQAPQALRQTCTLEHRPPGECLLNVSLTVRASGNSVTSSVACSFDCKSTETKAPQ